ncbi:MAG TPA: Wzz/FepE/Etk N-terminal domain-containing protein [Microbacterium sp.]|uniref:YveK family protein n=1 Tax=Microbacterium sp. TaxID=51671 RepID=UPI002B47D52A|nr:Wzz/FepE/Etk N-terminal domain-containing protein [Microbacterium sp.]HKT57444.1 Wzz/FepE/Etk N-terminal domain-containing protein [Microbacterium sp.]
MEDVPYGRILREGWLIILIVALAGALAAFGVTKLMPKTYAATSTLMLRVSSTPDTLFQQNQFSLARIQSYPQLVDSPSVIDGVRSDLDLSERDYSDADITRMLSATNPSNTVLLVVEADASTAKLSADMANSAARHLSALIEETENTNGTKIVVRLDVVLPAVEPLQPISPQVLAVTGLGLIAGLAIGAIVAVYRTTTNRSLRTSSDIRKASRLPLAGRIPRRSRAPRRNADLLRKAAFEETVGNLGSLGGLGVERYVLVSASPESLNESIFRGLVDAFDEAGARACVLDVRSDRDPDAGVRPLDEIVNLTGGPVDEPAGDRDGSVFALSEPVRSAEIARRLPEACLRLRDDFEVVMVAADASASGLIERMAALESGVVIAVRNKSTMASQLASLVTRLHVMGIRPVGALMTHAPLGDVSAVAETWRPSDRHPVRGEHPVAVGDVRADH